MPATDTTHGLYCLMLCTAPIIQQIRCAFQPRLPGPSRILAAFPLGSLIVAVTLTIVILYLFYLFAESPANIIGFNTMANTPTLINHQPPKPTTSTATTTYTGKIWQETLFDLCCLENSQQVVRSARVLPAAGGEVGIFGTSTCLLPTHSAKDLCNRFRSGSTT